jgi:polar amino acid transport system substrate-binding protein
MTWGFEEEFWMIRARSALLFAAMFLIAACNSGTGGSPSPTKAPSATAAASGTPAASTAAATTPAASSAAAGDPNDLLAKIKAAGVIHVGTDPNYAPQSFLKPDGTFEGFDIDVANEIGKRLGVTVKFETPDFSVVEAGGWAGRFDVSVGSVTITEVRKAFLDFTAPYYYTPAQMAATTASGITTLDGLAGKTICVGEGTTYFQWLEGTLKLGDGSSTAPVPAGAKATTLKTDQDCAQSAQSGRKDFEGWLSSSTTVAAAIKGKAPFVNVGDPVFFEPLAVATDKKGTPHAELQAALDKIITDMHADGTLTTASKKWFEGVDLTIKK